MKYGFEERYQAMKHQMDNEPKGLQRIVNAGNKYLKLLGDDAGRQEIVHLVELAEESLLEEKTEVERLREAAKAAAAMISAACTAFVRAGGGGVIKTPEGALQTLLDALGGEDQMEIDSLRKAMLTAGFALRGNKAPDLALKILIEEE